MSDRELLALAAKAAGYTYTYAWSDKFSAGYTKEELDLWNPLCDEGSALRLLVKLKMDINIENDGVTVWYYAGYADVETISEDVVDGDFLSATRRAIVRAAAEIGKAL